MLASHKIFLVSDPHHRSFLASYSPHSILLRLPCHRLPHLSYTLFLTLLLTFASFHDAARLCLCHLQRFPSCRIHCSLRCIQYDKYNSSSWSPARRILPLDRSHWFRQRGQERSLRLWIPHRYHRPMCPPTQSAKDLVGAGLNDVTLGPIDVASKGFFNDTHQQFDYNTSFPWALSMGGDTNYAGK